MRTTVTLDDDLAEKLKDYARRRRTSFKDALNGLLRRGLSAQEGPQRRKRFVVKPHRARFCPGVDPGRLNQLLDEMDVADFLRKAGPRR